MAPGALSVMMAGQEGMPKWPACELSVYLQQ